MLEKLIRLKSVIILVVFVTGLAVIALEYNVGPDFPETASLIVRTLFWLSAIIYVIVRISEKRGCGRLDKR